MVNGSHDTDEYIDIELQFWRECSKMFDSNGDGHINADELASMLEALGIDNVHEEEITRLVPYDPGYLIFD